MCEQVRHWRKQPNDMPGQEKWMALAAYRLIVLKEIDRQAYPEPRIHKVKYPMPHKNVLPGNRRLLIAPAALIISGILVPAISAQPPMKMFWFALNDHLHYYWQPMLITLPAAQADQFVSGRKQKLLPVTEQVILVCYKV